MHRPRVSVLLNNFNYGRFVVEAVGSALAQTVPPDEVVVVDDGSTDDSLPRLRAAFAAEPRVRVVAQPNAGMLAAHNRAWREAGGDILLFLDADDLWLPRRIEAALAVFARHPEVGVAFCPLELFGHRSGLMYLWPDREALRHAAPGEAPPAADLHFGEVGADVLLTGRFLAAPTSALAFRRSALAALMPLSDFEAEWRNHSDAALVCAAALGGCAFHFSAEPQVRYRAHGGNDHLGRGRPPAYYDALELRSLRLAAALAPRLGLPPARDPAPWRAVAERLRAAPWSWREPWRYGRRLGAHGLPPATRARLHALLWSAWLRGRLRRRAAAPRPESAPSARAVL